MAKFIFVTGGVVSGIGKGITAASIGRMLKDRGLSVFMQKCDPYINVDPGTMSPYQHGEVYVTKDGAETDLDLGHYERFIDVELTQDSNITSGRIYHNVIQKERRGEYNGSTVQVIPHITDEIKQSIYRVARDSKADVIITEIGGTIGDIESLPFIEAIRQIHAENKKEDVLFVHTTLVPIIPSSNELKTKPTQHSYKELMSLGIKPNIFVLRCDEIIPNDVKEKISLFCDVPLGAIVQSENVDLIYEVPLSLEKQGLDDYILKKLELDLPDNNMIEWKKMVEKFKNCKQEVKIALVGKYVKLHDAYLSVSQALIDAGYSQGYKVDISWIDSETVNTRNYKEIFSEYNGIIVPGGFGKRGVEGMMLASRYSRENHIPYFGICYGMQLALIDIATDLIKLEGADTAENDPDCKNPIISLMEDQKNVTDIGGTLRLGNWDCKIKEGSKVYELYGQDLIKERHRHRYEFNVEYKEVMERTGVIFSGINPDTELIEIIELKNHPHFVACQFHPEFKSRPNRIHPLFKGFIDASVNNKNNREKSE